eukprot:scaffold5287_cov345-Prasinococcus_capsulatus_cf.AAC.4
MYLATVIHSATEVRPDFWVTPNAHLEATLSHLVGEGVSLYTPVLDGVVDHAGQTVDISAHCLVHDAVRLCKLDLWCAQIRGRLSAHPNSSTTSVWGGLLEEVFEGISRKLMEAEPTNASRFLGIIIHM